MVSPHSTAQIHYDFKAESLKDTYQALSKRDLDKTSTAKAPSSLLASCIT